MSESETASVEAIAARLENPHAYPVPETNADGSFAYWHNGMTLRDWFAGQCGAVAFAYALDKSKDGQATVLAAQLAYGFADAMLAERAAHLAAQVQA